MSHARDARLQNDGFGARYARMLETGLEQFVQTVPGGVALGSNIAGAVNAIPWGILAKAGSPGEEGKDVIVVLNEPIPISPFSFYPSMDMDKSYQILGFPLD